MKKVVALNASGIAAGAVALLLVVASTATAAVLWHGFADWVPQAGGNPVFESGAPGAWDEHIRERMAIIYDNGMYKAWYGGWQGTYNKTVPNQLKMGYATSPDGIHWTKHPTPVYWGSWTEDLCIVKSGDTFYMYAEDESNNKTVVDLLTSGDGINWTNRGHVLERPGSWLGTPLVWKESSKWYMLFEDAPAVIKLITSSDGIHWQPQNEAVASDIPGAVGPSSILKRDGTYYLFFTQSMGARWSDGIAQSTDLVHWTPYSGNPLLDGKATSAVVLETPTQYVLYGWNDDSTTAGGSQYRLYTSAKTAPEPSCAALLGAAMIGLAVYGQWKRMQRRKES